MPAYTRDAASRFPVERALRLPGYPGGDDKAGNRVNRQFQLDNFGEALLLFAAAARHDRLAGEEWRAEAIAADAIESAGPSRTLASGSSTTSAGPTPA